MELNTNNSKDLLPARVLGKTPNFLNEDDLRKVSGKDITIVDMGSLVNVKKFMKVHTDHRNNGGNSSMKKDDWSGTYTWDDYLQLLDNGDQDVMDDVKNHTARQVKELSKKYKEVLRTYKFDVEGEFFDVGLVLTGVPETWLQPEPTDEEVLQVDILLDGAFDSGVDTQQIVKSASRILGMVKILEDHNIQVGIKMVNNNVDYDNTYSRSLVMVTHIKDYNEPINFKKVSALLTPATHRRACFKVMEVSCDYMGSGYGAPRPLEGTIRLDNDRAVDRLERTLFKGR